MRFAIEEAPSADEVTAVMESVGLRAVAVRGLSLGTAAVHVVTKRR